MKQILVRAPNWIGDQILAYPFFYYLRRGFPKAKITSVCVPWVRGIQFRDCVDDVHVVATSREQKMVDRFLILDRAGVELRRPEGWDLAISLPNSLSAAWLMLRAKAHRRRGYSQDGRGLLLNDRLPWRGAERLHRAQAYLNLLPDEIRPPVDASEFWGRWEEDAVTGDYRFIQRESMSEFSPLDSWHPLETLDPPSDPYWVLAPGATADSRRWPVERYVELARKIEKKTNMRGVIVGGGSEKELAQRICLDLPACVDLTGRAPLENQWKIFKQARFTVCNESGLSHFAALCGSPVQVICGAADPRKTRPIGPGRVQVRVNPVDCWPCEKNTCWQPGSGHLQCLLGLDVEDIWKDIEIGFSVALQ